MKTIHLIFGVHWHAPLGTGDHDFESVYQDTYKHFLSTLYEIENLPVVLHYSGIVLEFLERNHPEYLNLVDEMVKRKQVELLGGGFFDPMLPLIPLVDKIGQIEMCTTYLRSHFGKRPRGLWLPEQVWEPSLPNTLKSCGIEYTFLNEIAFTSAHREDDELFYPHFTEDQGKNVAVFPLCMRLKDLVFQTSPRHVIDFIKKNASHRAGRVISLIMDGDCYTRTFVVGKTKKQTNWLKEFYAQLEDTQTTILPLTPSEYLKKHRVTRKVYFSSTFSPMIFRSTLPPECRKRMALLSKRKKKVIEQKSGSNFKQVFNKYRESNLLYAKMMYTHLNVHQMRGDKSRKKSALEELWRGQCHYGYWHGKHLGIYDNHVRKETYKSFIIAEKYSRIKGTFLSSIISADFDFDGENELLYQSNEMNVYVHLQGGMVFELDYLPAAWNYCDTMARIREYYHSDHQQACDVYPRKAFIDHFFVNAKRTNPLSSKEKAPDLCDSASANYLLVDLKREQRTIQLAYTGQLAIQRKKYPVEMTKQYSYKKNTIVVTYGICNKSEKKISVNFGSEINLSLLSLLKENLRIFDASKKSLVEIDPTSCDRVNVKTVSIEDRLNNVVMELSSGRAFSLYSCVLMTAARENGAIKNQFQGVSLLPYWEVVLEPAETWEGYLELLIQKM